MPQGLLLVDYENVQDADLSLLDANSRVIVFVGSRQPSIPFDLVASAQRLGDRVEWRRIEGNGNNALDFHIACHLGRILETAPDTRCIILSKDKGYDPLLSWLKKQGLRCRRVSALSELLPAVPKVDSACFNRVVDLLGRSQKQARPKRLEKLSTHVMAMLARRVSEVEVQRIIEALVDKELIAVEEQAVTYNF